MRCGAVNITVYGDSILKGVLFENGRYVLNRSWEQLLAETYGLTVRNRSHFGCTIEKALPALRRDSETPGSAQERVLLEFGGNDCDYDWAAIAEEPEGRHRCKTPPEQFAADYREAIRLVREGGRIPVAMTLPPIHSERYLSFLCRGGLSRANILRWLRDVEAIARWQAIYSDLVFQLSREEQTELIDLRSAFPREREALEHCLCDDGIHPSRLGQELIFGALRERAAQLAGRRPLSA